MDPSTINWLAVLLAAVSSFIIGGAWSSPLLFAKPWARLNGFGDQLGGNPALIFGLSFVAALIASVMLSFFIGPTADLMFGLFAGLATGAGWVAMAFATTYLFERRSLALWAINAGYHVVSFTVMGTIIGAL